MAVAKPVTLAIDLRIPLSSKALGSPAVPNFRANSDFNKSVKAVCQIGWIPAPLPPRFKDNPGSLVRIEFTTGRINTPGSPKFYHLAEYHCCHHDHVPNILASTGNKACRPGNVAEEVLQNRKRYCTLTLA